MLDETYQYYLDGSIYRIERFFKGVKQGVQEAFYPDGSLKTKEIYQAGQRDGEVLLYWPNKQRKRRVYFSQGRRVGIEEFWNREGALVETIVWTPLK